MRKVELQPLETNQPGYGQLVIVGWQGASEGLSLDIQRNQDECFLQDDGEWRSNSCKFHLPELQPTADGHLSAVVDQQIIDPLLESPHVTYMARFYGADDTQVGRARLRIDQGLMPSGASGSSPEIKASTAIEPPQPPPVIPEPQPEPQPEPEPVVEKPSPAAPELEPTQPEPAPAPTGKSKRWLWILLAVVILAAIIGASAWFGMSMSDPDLSADETVVEESLEDEGLEEEAQPEESAPDETSEANASEELEPAEPTPSEVATTAGPCSLQRMGEMTELEFIQACTSAESESGNMLDTIVEARDSSHCGIARRLYAHQALNGDTAAAMAYARELDPAQHAPSACFPEPDAETAIFWYETALGLDPDNTEAVQRLEELQQ